jgi:serine/threonine protein kinase/predicted Zn-dependent protease
MSDTEPEASGGDLDTGFAPPFRELVQEPGLAGTVHITPGSGPAAAPADNQLNDAAPRRRQDTDALRTSDRASPPVVPDYEILGELGRGGMGVVYKARHRPLNRVVALKMILAGSHAESSARLRFRTEAEAVARLHHPSIVQIYDVRHDADRPYLAMEYVDGGNLQQRVAGRPQPERAAAALVETLARAVAYMHERGILHRDLKPTNILLQKSEVRMQNAESQPDANSAFCLLPSAFLPKITDFGLAKLQDGGIGLTRSETFLGTPNYMAPEQALGDLRRVTAQADVYSLGAILYELLTGCPPFSGTAALEVLEHVRRRDPARPRRLRPSLSVDLETICLRCLEKDPGRRYASATALADELQRFLDGRPIQARPVAAWEHALRYARRRPAACAAACLAVAALLCLLVTCWWYLAEAGRRAERHAEDQYRQFVDRRNEAILYGLLAPEQGALFLGAEVAANRARAEASAHKALALAGIDGQSNPTSAAAGIPATRRAEVINDSYALLLLLAGLESPVVAPEPQRGQRDREALTLLERAQQLGIRTRAYHLRRARILGHLGESEQAQAEAELAVKLPLAGALDHFLLGEEQYRRGEWDRAMHSFDRALTAQPGHFWAQFFLAVCHLKRQQWDTARTGFNACLTQQPGFVWGYVFRSFANERSERHDDARADFERALELNPNADARYVVFLTRGILHFHQNELEHAAEDFRSAIALKPRQYNAYLNLAQVCLMQNRFAEAAEQECSALALGPPDQVLAAYQVERGRHLLRAQQYAAALEACDLATRLAPAQPSVHEVRGRTLLALGRPREAEAAFDDYLRAGGEATTDLFRGRGQARMKLGKFADAVDDYTRALGRAPPDSDIYQHRGWAHFFSDAWKLALRDFSKAIELDATAADAYIGRGLALVMLGDYRAAVADADAALDRRPKTPEMMHNIACAFAQAVARAEADSGQPDHRSLAARYRGRAVAALRQALAMVPSEQRRAFWQEKVLPDAALAPLRNAAEFRQLTLEMAARPQ